MRGGGGGGGGRARRVHSKLTNYRLSCRSIIITVLQDKLFYLLLLLIQTTKNVKRMESWSGGRMNNYNPQK